MKNNLTFLGIETSCDETAASIVRAKADGTGEILSNIVSSQVEEHKEFGGVVPEIAARAHVEKIEFIIKKANFKRYKWSICNSWSRTSSLSNSWFKCGQSYCWIFK